MCAHSLTAIANLTKCFQIARENLSTPIKKLHSAVGSSIFAQLANFASPRAELDVDIKRAYGNIVNNIHVEMQHINEFNSDPW